MNFIDILLLIALCWFGFRGFKNGFIYELFSILALVLGCWIAFRFSNDITRLITDAPLAQPVSLLITFALVVFLTRLAGNLFSKIIKLSISNAIDHIFGLLFGVCKVLAVSSVVLFIIQDLDTSEILFTKEIKEKSIAFQYAEPIVPHALGWDAANHYIE